MSKASDVETRDRDGTSETAEVFLETHPLRSALIEASARAIGGDDHIHFSLLLSEATPYVLMPSITSALARTLRARPFTIEQNLDFLDIPSNGIWVEWADLARNLQEKAAPGSKHPVRNGVLICPAPDNPDRLTIMTGWQNGDGMTQHSFAAGAVSKEALKLNAWLARNRFSVVPRESEARMLSQSKVYFPPGLEEELNTLTVIEFGGRADLTDEQRQDIVIETKRRARIDVAGDIPFAFAAALAVLPEICNCRKRENGLTIVDVFPKRSIDKWIAWIEKRFRRDWSGFVRRGSKKSPRLLFVPDPAWTLSDDRMSDASAPRSVSKENAGEMAPTI